MSCYMSFREPQQHKSLIVKKKDLQVCSLKTEQSIMWDYFLDIFLSILDSSKLRNVFDS